MHTTPYPPIRPTRPTTPAGTIECPKCHGHGEVVLGHPSGNPELDAAFTCPECEGTGAVELEVSDERLVAVPAGVPFYRGELGPSPILPF